MSDSQFYNPNPLDGIRMSTPGEIAATAAASIRRDALFAGQPGALDAEEVWDEGARKPRYQYHVPACPHCPLEAVQGTSETKPGWPIAPCCADLVEGAPDSNT